MKFALVVEGSPYGSAAAVSALQFAEAALAAGHDIYRVFFYHDGVYVGSALAEPPQDELPIYQRWQALHKERGVDLVICIASALRRGMLDAAEADRYEKSGSNVDQSFVISGLGQLIDAGLNADRLVTFAA